MAVPVFEFSSFGVTMVASQEASATVANVLFVLFPFDAIAVSSRDKSSNTGREGNLNIPGMGQNLSVFPVQQYQNPRTYCFTGRTTRFCLILGTSFNAADGYFWHHLIPLISMLGRLIGNPPTKVGFP